MMIFEEVSVGGCRSYLIGCSKTSVGALIDPETSALDRYKGLAAKNGLTVRYVIDTHTHADHFSGAHEMAEALGARVVMHRDSPAPRIDLKLDDGDMLLVGDIRMRAVHTPGHTRDSICLLAEDRIFTGDTLLVGATGRTDLPTGDPEQLFDSLFGKILTLDPALIVCPAHRYKDGPPSTIGQEIATNPRLQKKDKASFVAMMRELNLSAPTHLTEALRVNISGAKAVAQLLAEAAAEVPFIALKEVAQRVERGDLDLVILDVREKDAFEAGHIPGARHIPRGQLELKVNEAFPDPTARIVTVCEFGKISTLAAATLRELGFLRAAALDGGFKAWKESGRAVE
jgi:glyoxylase-like metal-dependent hydrolase (beta-lactamase superfamily II)/rhodanese-related sulfurtransferase